MIKKFSVMFLFCAFVLTGLEAGLCPAEETVADQAFMDACGVHAAPYSGAAKVMLAYEQKRKNGRCVFQSVPGEGFLPYVYFIFGSSQSIPDFSRVDDSFPLHPSVCQFYNQGLLNLPDHVAIRCE